MRGLVLILCVFALALFVQPVQACDDYGGGTTFYSFASPSYGTYYSGFNETTPLFSYASWGRSRGFFPRQRTVIVQNGQIHHSRGFQPRGRVFVDRFGNVRVGY